LLWTTDRGSVLTETVTVTLASPPSDAGESVVTKAESNQSGESLPPETTQLLSSLSSLQTKIFAQLQGLQLQSTYTPTNGSAALIAVNNHSPPSPASLLDSTEGAINSLVLGQGHSLQAGAGLTQHSGTLPGSGQALVTMGQLGALGEEDESRGLEGGAPQILLGDGHTLPVQIVGSHPAL
ncbi:CARTF factor, partial [Oreotrochilus melanogaster]|nr:CARTF factor [Oreotrochilus melanogaster]